MVVYTGKVYNHTINSSDALALSGNIAILSVFYVFVGSLLSFVLYYLFDEYDPNTEEGKRWEKRSLLYKLGDVSLEVLIIALASFWLVFSINTSAPIIPVPQHFAAFVDTYTTGMFFMFSIFIFLSSLSEKLRYLFESTLGKRFDVFFPSKGHLLDLTLHY